MRGQQTGETRGGEEHAFRRENSAWSEELENPLQENGGRMQRGGVSIECREMERLHTSA